ncbi:hypothetical protein V4F39_03815 [Aquincola sp. MAHUQ-54]|uniref:MxaK protein n=1 Tax=Aquincola agrisoli TaxID=3119538 RepID=A0AAW9Q6C8_9BURK
MDVTKPAWATRRRTRAVLLLAAGLAVAAALDGSLLWRDTQRNAAIAEVAAGAAPPQGAASLPEGALPELRFAAAYAQALQAGQQASRTAAEAALNRYRPLQGDTPLGQAARFNSANLLMRQAMAVRATQQPGQAIALLELAKEGYREVLRHDPGFWPARYNLERAQRLLPDAEEEELQAGEPAPESERAVTTMRGHSPGLP